MLEFIIRCLLDARNTLFRSTTISKRGIVSARGFSTLFYFKSWQQIWWCLVNSMLLLHDTFVCCCLKHSKRMKLHHNKDARGDYWITMNVDKQRRWRMPYAWCRIVWLEELTKRRKQKAFSNDTKKRWTNQTNTECTLIET